MLTKASDSKAEALIAVQALADEDKVMGSRALAPHAG